MSQVNQFSESLIRDLIKNQKRERFWRNLRFFTIIIVTLLLFFILHQIINSSTGHDNKAGETHDYIALIRLNGEISADKPFSAKETLPLLQSAFSDEQAKGVVLDINSGGGSPVQSSIIAAKIRQLKHKYHKKVVVVGEDLLASGAYLVSTGADKIYVNADTITGSIGVIMAGFGFNDVIKTLGIGRRVYTAGDNKDRLDAFKPVTAADKAKIQSILDETHQDFIALVKQSRGDRLKGDPSELFSGDFWTGTQAMQLGLVDGVGNLADVLPKEFNVDYYVDYSAEPGLLALIMKNAQTVLHLPLSSYRGAVLNAEV